MKKPLLCCCILFFFSFANSREWKEEGLPLCYWQQKEFVNFGDYLGIVIVERIIQDPVRVYKKTKKSEKKLLGLGSLLYFANTGDVLWGTGCNYKYTKRKDYSFTVLDIRAVRGPLTKAFIEDLGIRCPEVYGDPALLFPYLFPEFKKKRNPTHPFIIIPHFYEKSLFQPASNVISPTEPWNKVIRMILDSAFVISGSLHAIIIAESYGIPARYLRLSENEPLFKYKDYYAATGRDSFCFATSVKEALYLGGEPPIKFDPKPLWNAFPFEFWPNAVFAKPKF